MIWLILTTVAALLLWYYLMKPMKHFRNLGIKQTNPWPLFGDMWRVVFRRKSFCEFNEWVYNLHPNVRYMGFYQFLTPTLQIRDPELIKNITTRDFDHFVDHKIYIAPENDPVMSGNLFGLKGQKWREMRATISGVFTSAKMKHMFNLMNETAQSFTKHFMDKNEELMEVEMKETFSRYTNDVIATTAFGVKVDSLAEPNNSFYLMGKEVSRIFMTSISILLFTGLPKIMKALRISIFGKEISTFFQNVISEIIKTRQEHNVIRPDMINILLETRKGIQNDEVESVDAGFATVSESPDIHKFRQYKNLSDQEICSQAFLFFLAGYDGISSALSFLAYELALNEDVQTRLRKEIQENHSSNGGSLTYYELLKMKYLDMVVSELLRKWPLAVGIDRQCTKDYTITPCYPDEAPVNLKTGDTLWLPFFGIHRDPKYYPNPEKFDPERFSDENRLKIIPYTYMPFGVGPRNCIGSRFALLEMKVLMYNLLANFEFVKIKRTAIPLVTDPKSSQLTAKGGFWLGLKRTENCF